MEQKKMLPIGYEDFEELRTKDFYYVDKTGLIRDLLQSASKVTLFTRPRRFGKSLNMSMLAHFFSLRGDKSIFDGLEVAKERALCERHMGKYPVIFLTLKGIDAQSYETAFRQAARLIRNAALKVEYLASSEKLSAPNKADYQALLNLDMSEETLGNSLWTLSELLEKHHGRKAVLLIDEYDVPLARAHAGGYYDQMVSLIRSLLGAALKTNTSLEFAVLTGCLRISKESIFTGLNNLKVRSISDVRSAEYFGFTDAEVRDLLGYYGYLDSYAPAKKWYDGYRFGNKEIYCPWDVLNYCDALLDSPAAQPENYWINTSSNDAIRRFVALADDWTRNEIERLVSGETIEKKIREDLTYADIYDNIDNLWSLLYMTGYLTAQGRTDDGRLRLRIPNLEVRDVFLNQVWEYFKESVKADTDTLNTFCAALQGGDAHTVERIFSRYLEKSISIRDNAVPDDRKESFYHGAMLGILMANGRMSVVSNREAGEGYADILAKSEAADGETGILAKSEIADEDGATGIIIEMKYAQDGDLDKACQDAIAQIDERRYLDAFRYTSVRKIWKYGIGCYRKSCKVVRGN